MKILYSVFLHKSYIWEKSCSWDKGQNTLIQSYCKIFKSTILQNKLMKQPNFLRVDTNLQKLKDEWKFFGYAWSKIGVANLVSGL